VIVSSLLKTADSPIQGVPLALPEHFKIAVGTKSRTGKACDKLFQRAVEPTEN
jgi:hypothetical protein